MKSPTSTATAVTVGTTVETDVLTGIAANQGTPHYGVGQSSSVPKEQTIVGTVNFTTGTAGTAVAIRCYDEDGNQIGTTKNNSSSAANVRTYGFSFHDTSGRQVSSYKITVQQTAATGNGTVNEINAYVITDG